MDYVLVDYVFYRPIKSAKQSARYLLPDCFCASRPFVELYRNANSPAPVESIRQRPKAPAYVGKAYKSAVVFSLWLTELGLDWLFDSKVSGKTVKTVKTGRTAPAVYKRWITSTAFVNLPDGSTTKLSTNTAVYVDVDGRPFESVVRRDLWQAVNRQRLLDLFLVPSTETVEQRRKSRTVVNGSFWSIPIPK
jgi:hypothetical protein